MNVTANEPLMVTIRCLTYNQENYIRRCLDGFVMQKTNFRFEAIVHDDASTDGTAAVIREYAEKYPDIIKPLYETENQYSKHDGSLGRIMNAHTHGKYVAMCEGDDYWTDPMKLQQQVDFMEAHPECALTYHACENLFEGERRKAYGECVKSGYSPVELMRYPFQTSTVVLRKCVLVSDLYAKARAIGCTSGDEILFLTASCFGTIRGFNRRMSVYRRHDGGMSQRMYAPDHMWKNFNDWLQVAELFGGDVGEWIRKRRLSDYLRHAILHGHPALEARMVRLCARRSPVTIPYVAVVMVRRFFGKA